MKSIHRDLATKMGVATLILFLLGAFGLYFSLREALQTQFDGTLKAKASALILASEVDDGELEIDLDVQAFAGFGSSAPGDYFEAFDADGTSMLRSPSLGSNQLEPPAEFFDSERGFSDIDLPEGVSGRAFWTVLRPFISGDVDAVGPAEEYRMLVASSDSTLRRTQRTVALFTTLFGVCGIISILAILSAAVRSGLRPLDRLTQDVQRIDVRHLERRLGLDDLPVELRGMPGKFNELLERLEASFNRERRFTSNAAHELRTPIAELRAMTELGTQWPDEFTAEHGREMLEVLSELEGLLNTLSVLARAETGAPEARENIEVGPEVRELLERCGEEADARRIEFELELEEGSLETEPVLWRAVVQNLLGNAAAYTPEGSTVRVDASPARLRVENEAPELEPADVPRLFERFWRKSPSRSEKGHSGLGLSIVRAAVDHLGGSCHAGLDEGRLHVEVRW